MPPLAGIGAVAQGILGVGQLFGGLLTRRPKRPEYEIPDEFNKNIGLAQGIKNMGMDKYTYLQALQEIGRNQSTGLSALQSRRGSLAGISSIVQRSNDALLNLQSADARMKQDNMRYGTRLEMGANDALADQRIRKFSWDKMQPYMDKINQRNALIGAGMQNIAGAGQSYDLLNYDNQAKKR